MSPLSDELLLMLLIVGLYLYDSGLLLFCNEGILVPVAKGWKIQFGFREPRISPNDPSSDEWATSIGGTTTLRPAFRTALPIA